MGLRILIQPGQVAVSKPGVDINTGPGYAGYSLHIGFKTDHIMQHGYAPMDGNRNLYAAYPETFVSPPDVWFQMHYPDGRTRVPPAQWFPQAQQFVMSGVGAVTVDRHAWAANFPIASNIAGAPAEPIGAIFTVHRRAQS